MTKLRHKKDSTKWHLRYLRIAREASSWSKHPSYKVGAVAIGDHGQVLSTGFNGWPRNISGEETGREQVDCGQPSLTIHAETNVIYNASLSGVSLLGSTLYVHPVFPCVECAKAIVQVGVSQICYEHPHEAASPPMKDGGFKDWSDSWKWAEYLFKEAGVTVTRINGKV